MSLPDLLVLSFFMRHIIFFIILVLALPLQAQVISEVNLVENGNFEKGNTGFKSDYYYNSQFKAGQYYITGNAASMSGDMFNPTNGDHTTGHGQYLVANAAGVKGRRVWYAAVQVLPNSRYYFNVSFCNLFKHQPAKTSFSFDPGDIKGNDPYIAVTIGGDPVLTERDFYHVYQWVGAGEYWYSGTHHGTVWITIENINTAVFGNDLALDDIGLFFVETMPKGYKPPGVVATVVNKEYAEATKENIKRRRTLSEYGIFEHLDTIADGIYQIRYRAAPTKPPGVDTAAAPRIRLQNISFNQGKAYLLPPAMKQLDLIAEWMKTDTLVRVRFIGHTDNVGDSLLNVQLSEERVHQVRQYLLNKGIAVERIEIIGVGGSYPLADNTTEEGRKLNRRVEMEILKP